LSIFRNKKALFQKRKKLIKKFQKIPDYSWSPTEFILNETKFTVPLPECGPTNFDHSVGLRFQAEATREAIAKGIFHF
jgi:hypothetical protein